MLNKIFVGTAVFYYAAVLLVSIAIFQSCESPATTSYVESRIGKEVVATLRQPDSVTTSDDIQFDTQELQKLLLNDHNYIQGMTKSSVFIPTITFKFQKDQKTVDVVFSPSCNELKIVTGDRIVIMDYDPAQKAFGDFLQSFNKNNKE